VKGMLRILPLAAIMAAMTASAETYWASVTSGSYSAADPVAAFERRDRYLAYLCTAESVQSLFAGAVGIEELTSYLAEHYDKAMGLLNTAAATGASGVSLLGSRLVADGQYSLTQYFAEGLSGDYLAVLAYAYRGERAFRVFGNSAADGSVLLDPETKKGGKAGAWTEAPSVPEPTGMTLLALGLAALALRRRRVPEGQGRTFDFESEN